MPGAKKRRSSSKEHVRETINSAIVGPKAREEYEQQKRAMLLGIRYCLRVLGIQDGMLQRFVEQEFQAWAGSQPMPPKKPVRGEGR